MSKKTASRSRGDTVTVVIRGCSLSRATRSWKPSTFCRFAHDIEIVFDEAVASQHRQSWTAIRPPSRRRSGHDEETIVTFEDDGAAFDPRAQPAPPPARRRSDLRIGGADIMRAQI